MKLYMFRTVRLSIIRSLFTVHSAMVYVIHVCRQLSSRSICSSVYELSSCLCGYLFICTKQKTHKNHLSSRPAFGSGVCVELDTVSRFEQLYITFEQLYITFEQLYITFEQLNITFEQLYITFEQLYITFVS